MKFSDKLIESLKPTDAMQDLREGHGFGIRVLPSGIKTWFFIYRIDGKRRFMNLGHYPSIKLSVARKKYRDAFDLYEQGKDPATLEEQQKEERRKAPTISDLVADYIKRYAMIEKRSWKKDEAILNRDVMKAWGNRKAADITKKDVNILLRGIVDRGSPIMARNTLAVIRKMFNWSIEEDDAEYSNPCLGVKTASASTPRERNLSEEEIKTLWESLDRPDLSMDRETGKALKLVLLTAQRPGEVSGMHTRELNGNWWTIPADRAKNKKTHRVYLTNTALELIGSLTVTDKKTGEVSDKGFIFPTPHKKEVKPIGNTALAIAVSRNLAMPVLDKKGKPVLDSTGKPTTKNLLGVEKFIPHDLRRTAATLLSKAKIKFEDRERVLNHSMGKLDETYNQHDYDDEKQIALEELERRIKAAVEGVKQADIIPITRSVNA